MKFKCLMTLLLLTNIVFSQQKKYSNSQVRELDSIIKLCVKKVDIDNSIDNIKFSHQLIERLNKKYNNWSTNYYLMYFKTLIVRNSKVEEEAQNAYDSFNSSFEDVLNLSENERQKSELYVLKGFLYLTILSSNPIKYGKDLSKNVISAFETAIKIYPKNPRSIYLNAMFLEGMSKFFDKDYNLCQDLLLANKYFVEEFTVQEDYLYPSWGAEHAANVLNDNCNCSNKKQVN